LKWVTAARDACGPANTLDTYLRRIPQSDRFMRDDVPVIRKVIILGMLKIISKVSED
jgi:hypothetical protein